MRSATHGVHQALYPTSNVAAVFEKSDSVIMQYPNVSSSRNAPPFGAMPSNTDVLAAAPAGLMHESPTSSAPVPECCDQHSLQTEIARKHEPRVPNKNRQEDTRIHHFLFHNTHTLHHTIASPRKTCSCMVSEIFWNGLPDSGPHVKC